MAAKEIVIKQGKRKSLFTIANNAFISLYAANGIVNPDEISVDTYRKMLYDYQINSAFKILTMFILSKGAGEYKNRQYPEIEKEVNDIIERMEQPVFEIIKAMLEAIWAGYSVQEIVTKWDKDRKLYYTEHIYPISPVTISFDFDKKGLKNKKGIIQNVGFSKNIYLDRKDCMIYSFDRDTYSDVYGNSKFQSIYEIWVYKAVVLNFWLYWSERYASPLPVGTIKDKGLEIDAEGNRIETNVDLMTKILSNLQVDMYAVLPEDLGDIKFHQPPQSGGVAYSKLLSYLDTAITRGLLVPDLLISNSGVGSNALGKTHRDTFITFVENIQNELSPTLISDWIKPLIELNHGELDYYGKWQFDTLKMVEKEEMIKIIDLLVGNGNASPNERWIRHSLGIPADRTLDIDSDKIKKEMNEQEEKE